MRAAVPELLSPAGSVDAVRAAVANGADAIYLGASRFNARDDGAQLTMAELAQACRIAHAQQVRVYLTLNVLVKPAELAECLEYLGECIDAGIDAAIVQDVGLIRLIQHVYPGFEIHGSTQLTVHDVSGARVMERLGVERVVLARENTLEDIRAIHEAVPALGLETFVHGALCISYSGQCFMSGMISERSANRGSCAQSCRKDYVLTDARSGAELDRGYLISAKDLGAYEHLAEIAAAGIGCLKIEGRKKKPEYVATVTKGYRGFLDAVEQGQFTPPSFEEVQPLVQIFSRGFTGGMYGGRAGRDYITRTQPDNRGLELGTVVEVRGNELILALRAPLAEGDGVGFEPPEGGHIESRGFTVTRIRTLETRADGVRQAVLARVAIPVGWRVVRSADVTLLAAARASYEALPATVRAKKVRLDVRCFGQAGAPLKATFTAADESVTVLSELPLAPATNRAIDEKQLREQLGRLGETPFALTTLDASGLGAGLFLPVRELNHLRQRATDELLLHQDWAAQAARAARRERVAAVVESLTLTPRTPATTRATLVAECFRVEDAYAALDAGAEEVILDPFLRHPFPSVTAVRGLRDAVAARGATFRLRLPSIVRPEERSRLTKWLALDTPLLTGHLGLVAEFASTRDVTADYAVNCFNAHTAAELFAMGATTLTASVELTLDEIATLVAPWRGAGFETVVYGRPEGMTLEHCVLSAAFGRVATHCRDLCTKSHIDTALTDPAGYTFPVATDYACRNRLLHSRPIEASEFLPGLDAAGVRRFRLLFNVFGEPVGALVRAWREAVDAPAVAGRAPGLRSLLGDSYTRGHFARAV
ncbi:MAG: U32 family peptidase [Gemmatimonadaceae bacterium]|nr:U32 family peptidase [Gemmatimonadaceae bacterium]